MKRSKETIKVVEYENEWTYINWNNSWYETEDKETLRKIDDMDNKNKLLEVITWELDDHGDLTNEWR